MRHIFYFFLALGVIGCSSKQPEVNDVNSNSQSKKENPQINKSVALADTTAKSKEVFSFKILPIDESKSDSSLNDFISNLKLTVKKRDKTALLKIIDPEIVVSEGGGMYGIKEFSNEWNLQNAGQSKIWTNLEGILKMGGTWEDDDEGKYFSIPYTQSNKAFSKFKYDFDWYNTAVIKASDVKVLKEPRATSNPIGTLNYDVVEVDPDYSHSVFSKIVTIDRKIIGYVKHTDLEYSANRALVLRKKGNEWKITSYAPFD